MHEQQELPGGWRYADETPTGSDWAPRRGRIVLRVGLAVLAVAVVLGGLAALASVHYGRGVEALRHHSYNQAAVEFSQAKILIVPYRDADRLETSARSQAANQSSAQAQDDARVARVVTLLEQAQSRLLVGKTSGVVKSLSLIPATDLHLALDRDLTAQDDAGQLARDLLTAARTALRSAKWDGARRLAVALLLLDPSNADAAAVKSDAQRGAALRDELASARAAANRGQWRTALRLALAVLAARKDFPGAAALVADARTALKPKPKPAKTPAASTTGTTSSSSSTSGGGSSGSTTPTAPAPP